MFILKHWYFFHKGKMLYGNDTSLDVLTGTEVNAHCLFANGSISGWVISGRFVRETEVIVKILINFI